MKSLLHLLASLSLYRQVDYEGIGMFLIHFLESQAFLDSLVPGLVFNGVLIGSTGFTGPRSVH